MTSEKKKPALRLLSGGRFWAALLAAALLAFVFSAFVPAAKKKGAGPSPDVQAIEKIVRDYLLRNPEVLVEAMQVLERKQKAEAFARAKQVLASRKSEIFHDPTSPASGDPKGDVTLVEFFDYRCGFCRRVFSDVVKALKDDPRLRIVYKEFPILGPQSLNAARAALASVPQGKYRAFHEAMMQSQGELTDSNIMKIAASVGLDTARLREDMNAPRIMTAIRRNYELARALGIQGTPAFVIGSELVRGAVELSELKRLIAKAREG